MLITVLAFLVALGLLIAVHEYGHYRVAVACGVKVLRFSIGFGKPLWRWQRPGSPTEFVLGMLPLGGYVKMLDEREGPVPAEERHLAFNTQRLGKRAAIVAAGPIANLLLAVLLYSLVNWIGVQEARAVLAAPLPGSIAAQAGLQGGDQVLRAGLEGEGGRAVRSFEDFNWLLTQGALDNRDLSLDVIGPQGGARSIILRFDGLHGRDADAQMFRAIGILGPRTPPVVGEVQPDGAAAAAGLRRGDVVRSIGGTPVADGSQLRELIRASVRGGVATTAAWQVERAGTLLALPVTPAVVSENGTTFGRVGAMIGGTPDLLTVRYGLFDGLQHGAVQTWDMSWLTLRMMGRMVIGQASLKNLSGPLTIADVAGKSARRGVTPFLTVLALLSVSLGVLNLLPLPVLDGGHLAVYLWEAATGKGVSETALERLQRGGLAVILLAMSIALYNDVTRLFG